MKFSDRDKKQYLSRIKDEVNVFHPLLNTLLPRLPRIGNVDHTHGVNENGADFVLTRFDDTIGDSEYIGLIVKIGKIHKSLSKIEEQIDECDEKRYVVNGKKKINLNEIWIVTNESITDGAKQKINRKYSRRKINFISAVHIIKWIDRYLPNYWYNMPLEIGDYLKKQKIQIVEKERSLMLISNLDINYYVKHHLHKIEFGNKLNKEDFFKRKLSKNSNIDLHNIIAENDIVLVEGRPGFGKSKMLRKLVSSYCSPFIYAKYKIIPLFVSYRELVEEYDHDIELLLSKKIDSKVKEYVSEKIDILIAIDGLDEKLLDTNDGIDQFAKLVNDLKQLKSTKAIISTRPVNDIQAFENFKKELVCYEILPLTVKKISNFIGKICEGVKVSERIIQDIKNSQLFKQLPKSPIAAILLASLLKENQKELPSTLTELYDKYGELMLGRWDVDKGLQSMKQFNAASTIINSIAKYFIENELEYLAMDEAKAFFDDYLSQRNLDINSSELFNMVTTRSGILQKEKTLNRVFFKHKTFCEFYCAKYIKDNMFDGFIDKKIYNPNWNNIYFFYIGLLTDCERELRKIANFPVEDPQEMIMKVVTIGDYFLAGYATPYKVVSEHLPIIILNASELFLNIVNNRVKSPLNIFPPMVVLIFFQKIIKNSFSYRFFRRAIDDTIVKIISDDKIEHETKIYALYFVSVILISLEEENPFDGMLDFAKEDLPLLVELVINYNTKNLYSRSKLLKKCEKKFHKKVKNSSPAFRKYLNSLFESPIDQLELPGTSRDS